MSAVDELIAAGARLVEAGLSPGSSGNLSIRDDDRILITGTGSSLGRLAEADIAVLDLDGTRISGARSSKESPLHVGFYRRDDAYRAVVHLHSPYAVAASCLEPWAPHSAVPPLTPYFVMRVGQTPLLPYRHPGDPELGRDLEHAPWMLRAALLANHGSIVAGTDMADAVDRGVELEEACRISLLTAQTPRREIDPEGVAELAARWDSPWQPGLSIH
ncbi:class II aldolase/adducin family protein [Microbacterium hatanonis]|jgi:L-fuculose-phosphate aldolase|uniref:Aldolase n=1 Tax=Microbacterium hatanonis TaxID=404366 RepID=A0A5C8I462_9MICO|nr:class II aldolase/adducin family protein [Microbacterium hatanonis]TXK12900.1 aldolase [Microbacterium hatanonis]